MTGTTPAFNPTEVIARHCPGLSVQSIDYFGEGEFCVAYLVNESWVFRFAKHEQAVVSLLREACLLPKIAHQFEVRIPFPQFVHVDVQTAFMGYPLLPGPVLTRERYLQQVESDRERCALHLARFLTQLHATDLALAQQCGIEAIHDRAYYGGLLTIAHRHLFARLAEPDRSFVEQTIGAYVESRDPAGVRTVVLHGDVGPGHVLYDERDASLTGMIDFGDLGLGDPAWDLVFIYDDYGLDFLCKFLRGYAPADPGSLLRRVYRFYVLDAIDWAVRSAQQATTDLEDATTQLSRLRTSGEQQLQELLSTCATP